MTQRRPPMFPRPRRSPLRRVALASIVAFGTVAAPASAQLAGSFSAPKAISDPAQTATPFDFKLVAKDDGHALAAWVTSNSVNTAYRPTVVGGALQPFDAAAAQQVGAGLSRIDVGINASSVARAAWKQDTGIAGADRYRIRVSAKANNGQAFGAPATVADLGENYPDNPLVRVGASGQSVLVYSWKGTAILSGGFIGNRYEGQYSAPGAAFPGEAGASPAILPDGVNQSGSTKLDVDDAGGALLTSYSSYCCNQRTIVNNARTPGDAGGWGTKRVSATGDGNDNGCLCNTPGNVNSVVLPGNVVGWSYGRKAPFGTSLFYVQSTKAGAGDPGTDVGPGTYELTAGADGYGLRIERDPAGNLLAAWFTGSGASQSIVTRYKPAGTAFNAWQAPQSTPAPSANTLDLAADGAGNFWMSYAEFTTAPGKVRVVKRTKATGTLSATETVSDTVGPSAEIPAITADADGYVTLIWKDGDPALGNQARVYSSTFTPTPPPAADPGSGSGSGPGSGSGTAPPAGSTPVKPPAGIPSGGSKPTTPTPLDVPRAPAKLTVERAGIKNGRLDVLARITSRATGKIRVVYQANGKTLKFTVAIPKTGRNVKISRRLTRRLRRGGTGLLTLVYNGNALVRADDVRLRAANRKALLKRKVAKIAKGRLQVGGTISKRARGVVRVRFAYPDATLRVRELNFSAKIAGGRWSINEKIPAVAAGAGGQLSIQYTGYRRGKIRGEQDAKAVRGSG